MIIHRKFIISTLILISTLSAHSQSIDKKTGNTINTPYVFALDSRHSGLPTPHCFGSGDASFGCSTAFTPKFTVKTLSYKRNEVNLALRTPILFEREYFNMIDIGINTGPRSNFATKTSPQHNVPTFKFTKDKGLNMFQTLGIIGVGVAREFINPNAPVNPDL